MSTKPPHFSATRLHALRRSGLFEGSGREAFGHLVEHVRLSLGVPVAIVSIVDGDRQVFAGHCGLPEPWASMGQTPITHSFCQHVVDRASPLVVTDANLDPTVQDNPAIHDLGVVAYLGVPICLPTGEVAGALAAIDTRPRVWTAHEEDLLRSLAVMVDKEIRLGVSERKYRTVLSDMREGFYVAYAVRDTHGQVVDIVIDEVNQAYTELTGLSVPDVVGRPLSESVPAALAELLPVFRQALDSGDAMVHIARSKANDSRIFESRIEPLDQERFCGFFRDVTAREDAAAHQQVVNREIGHRLKNTLAMVQAIAYQTLRAIPDQAPVDAFEHRLAAFGRAHDFLFQRSFHRAALREIAEASLTHICPQDRIDIEGPNLELGSRAALTCALLFHELGCNAIKHGAFSNATGRVALTWAIEEEGETPFVTLCWQEQDGPLVREPTHKGLGSRLIRMGLDGRGRTEVSFLPQGLTVRMKAPLGPLQVVDL